MRRYRIGEVSKMLDIPAETIRFLEQKGLITPQKNQSNNYRSYDIWDVDRLLDYKKYRQLGLSSKETVELIQNGSIQSLIDHLEEKRLESLALSRYHQAKMLKLKRYQVVLSYADKMLGKYLLMNRPANYALFTRTYNADEIEVNFAEDTDGGFATLTENYPFVEHVYCVRKEWLEHPSSSLRVQWGFLVKQQWADTFQIKKLPGMEFFPASSALFTIVRIPRRILFSEQHLDEVLYYIARHGYALDGDLLGVYLGTVREGDEAFRYMEVWAPVKSVETSPDGPHENDPDFLPLRQVFY